jgi:vacuolar-type H+-ATPase subunit F/Vma7
MQLVVIADEVSALGWRLMGAHSIVPGDPAAAATAMVRSSFRDAIKNAEVLLITAEYARLVPAAEMNAALSASKPLVLVIADLRHRSEPPQIEHEARLALGIPG